MTLASFISCTTFPGGTPIPYGGTTQSKGIELVGKGSPGASYEIVENSNVLAHGNFNRSGAFVEQLQNLPLGAHLFELREHASALPTSDWALRIGNRRPIGSILVGPSPWGLTLNEEGSRGYVPVGGKLQVIDTDTSTLLAPINIPQLINSWGMALTQNGTRAFVLNNSDTLVVDLTTSKVIATLPIHGTWIVPSREGSKVFISNYSLHALAVVDSQSFLFSNIPVGQLPRQLATSLDGNRVYVAYSSNAVAVVDARTLVVLKQIHTGFPVYGLAVSPDGNHVYAAGTADAQRILVKFDTSTGSTIWTLNTGTGTRGLAVNHSGTRVYCCYRDQESKVITIDALSSQVIATTQLPVGPMSLEISPDDQNAYVTCLDSHIVSVIDLVPGASDAQAQAVSSLADEDVKRIPKELFPGGVD
ncbi:YncE family protein [Pseudomonas sp. PHC1]|uniref:YncE family protein n=1 Tax=Pseudomonas sp. PHC1 TaxID=3384759 RepID=UPI00396F61F0